MTEQNTEAKLKKLLKQEKIQLWSPPYTEDNNQPGLLHLQELAERYAPLLRLPVVVVGGALESIRGQAVKRGKGNETFREMSVATLELLLPRENKKEFSDFLSSTVKLSRLVIVGDFNIHVDDPSDHFIMSFSSLVGSFSCTQHVSGPTHTRGHTLDLVFTPGLTAPDPKKKNYLETRLDVPLQQVADRILEDFGLKHIKLILNGRTLSLDQCLDEQGVKNHSKVMVLKVNDAEQLNKEEEEKKNQSESLQRTQKGFQILSERDGSEDPETMPFLEIADQKGNPLKIPQKEKKALILAMGFHEKGRSLMKRRLYDSALCHLLQADQNFSQCGSALLSSVDNYAVLQLDIVWCYQALEALSCLEDGRSRLLRAEDGFLRCYGEQQQRLLMIKGTSGREEVLFLRLHLLQALLCYLEGDDVQARQLLSKVESLFGRLCPTSEDMAQLMSLGFSEREARLGLRACHGDLQQAEVHISNRRQERQELMQRERQKRRTRMEAITTLTEFGFSRRDAARALHLTDGDMDKASTILLDSCQTRIIPEGTVSPEKMEQLLYLGFEKDSAEEALRLTGGEVQSATQLLLDNQGVLSPPSVSPTSEDTSTSSTSSTSAEDNELINEVLEDIPRHEEDYLDLTLDEESELITALKTYLSLTE